MKKRSLTVNAFLNGLRSVTNLIFPLITFPYVSRILSVSGMGKCSFSMTYVSYFVLISGLGIATYGVREGAKYRSDRAKIGIFASQIFTINIWATFISYVLLFTTLLVFNNLERYVVCILIFSIQILFTTLGTEWIYTIYEDYAYITIRSILFKVISIILLFALVKKNDDYLWYAFIIVFANVGSNILNYIHAKSICRIGLIRNVNWKAHLKPILVIFASSIAVSIYVSSDVTILGIMQGDRAVGLYNVPVRIYTMAKTLLSAILTVTIPRLAMLYGQNKLKDYNLILQNLINVLTILIFPASIGLLIMSKDVILLFAGSKYSSSGLALSIISIGIIFCIYNWIFTDCVLIPAKREQLLLKNTLISAALNIIFNIILIPFLSYNACSISTVLSEFIAMVLNFKSGKDILKSVVYRRKNLKNLFSVVIACGIIVFICLVIRNMKLQMLSELTISIILSIIFYFVILILFKNPIVISYLYKICK